MRNRPPPARIRSQKNRAEAGNSLNIGLTEGLPLGGVAGNDPAGNIPTKPLSRIWRSTWAPAEGQGHACGY